MVFSMHMRGTLRNASFTRHPTSHQTTAKK